MQNNVQKIKECLDIVEVVSSYLKLQKAGMNFKASCPFHNEKTPSFVVSPLRGTFHCFGCGKGGDIFTFIEEIEGLDFKGALKFLADKAGIHLEYQDSKYHKKKDDLYAILEDVTTFYQLNLTKNKTALAYLYKRGLKPETLKDFRIGFADDSWENCYNFLKKRGYCDEDIEKTGISVKKQNGQKSTRLYYDRFRSRIMFPIFDNVGRVIAFSGRIFGKEDENVGKYINSPETELFHKSNTLFGYDKAKMDIRKENMCILVEGQMDMIMSHQAGTKNTVAMSGTAFTEQHAVLISRISDTLVLALDADSAGLNATKKSAITALSKGLDVKVVELEKDNDPADIILKNVNKWKELVANAKHVIDFYLNILEKNFPDKRKFKLETAKHVLPLIKQIENKIDQSFFIDLTAMKLGIQNDILYKELEKVSVNDVLKREEFKKDFQDKSERVDIILKNIFGILLWQEKERKPLIHINTAIKRIKNLLGDKMYDKFFDSFSESEKQKYIFEAEANIKKRDPVVEIEELFKNLNLEILKRERDEVSKKIKEAECLGDEKLSQDLLSEFQNISKKIDNIKN